MSPLFSSLARRFLVSVPVAIGATFLGFLIFHLAPGEPAGMNMDPNANASNIRERIREQYGLNDPLVVQYGRWIWGAVRGDLGIAMSTDRRPVAEKIKNAVGITLLINCIELVLVFLVAVPLGMISAIYSGRPLDKWVTVTGFTLYSAPSFWTALLLMLFFGVELGWLPISGLGNAWYDSSMPLFSRILAVVPYLILPVGTILLGSIAGLTRYVRMVMLENLNSDFVRTARAKGLTARRIYFHHVFRNGLLPLITLVGLMLPGMLGGSVILESIFSLPGLGRLFYDAALQRDYNTLMAGLALTSVMTLAGSILADILYTFADPRARESLLSQRQTG